MISESESHAMQIVRRWLKKRKPFVEIELVFICTPLLIHCFFFFVSTLFCYVGFDLEVYDVYQYIHLL
jgi:hypothetical protein